MLKINPNDEWASEALKEAIRKIEQNKHEWEKSHCVQEECSDFLKEKKEIEKAVREGKVRAEKAAAGGAAETAVVIAAEAAEIAIGAAELEGAIAAAGGVVEATVAETLVAGGVAEAVGGTAAAFARGSRSNRSIIIRANRNFIIWS